MFRSPGSHSPGASQQRTSTPRRSRLKWCRAASRTWSCRRPQQFLRELFFKQCAAYVYMYILYSMYICLYIHIYISFCICIYLYVHACMCSHIHVHVLSICFVTRIEPYMLQVTYDSLHQRYTYIFIYIYTTTYTHTYIYIYIRRMYIHTHGLLYM